MSYNECIRALKKGEKVLIFDSGDREGETDIVQPAKEIDYEDISFMRNNGGGLICVTFPHNVAEELGLPFMSELMKKIGLGESDIPYGAKSSFSIWVNHKETFTGINDKDRAKTARELAKTQKKIKNNEKTEFNKQFRSPGHVPILRGSKGLLKNRKGHTELSMALAKKSGVLETMVICEMLSDKNGKSLSINEAKKFANKRNIPFVEGKEIIKRY